MGRNHYETLGVGSNCRTEDVRKAYRSLAREHHPDRHQGPERVKAEELFTAITEAFNILSDDARRKEYDQKLKDEAAGDLPQREAAQCDRAGRSKMELAMYDDAIRMFKAAIHLDPEPGSYYAHLAMALVKTGSLGEAVRTWDLAITREPYNGSFHRQAGECAEKAGMKTKARRYYAAAVKWNPDDSSAKAGLERVSETPEKKTGFLGNLFKK